MQNVFRGLNGHQAIPPLFGAPLRVGREQLPLARERERSLHLAVRIFVTFYFASNISSSSTNIIEECGVHLAEDGLRLRNMAAGLANGTRMLVKSMSTTVIEALITTGPKKGETAIIPRLLITPSDVDKYPFTLCWRQFPIRPAYVMTINKAQGQTLENVGIYLQTPVFAHGQLYTSLSRAGAPKGVAVLAPRDEDGIMYTGNIVYREVLI